MQSPKRRVSMFRILSFRIFRMLTLGILPNGTVRRSPSPCLSWSRAKSADGTCSFPIIYTTARCTTTTISHPKANTPARWWKRTAAEKRYAKNVCGLFLSCGILLFVVLRTARWYKKHPNQVPRGFTGLMEMIISYIQDGVIKESVGKDEYKPYSSYLLTVFFFILINNLIGIIPVFPGGANITGNIAVTAVLAGCTFIAVNLFATKEYWKDIFWPKAPIYLKLPLPIMPFVEFFGVFTKPFALMIRLFANIMAGHTIILALTSLIFITVSMGLLVNFGMTIVSVLFCVFMNCVELFVACLQAYIFTLLSANYIGMARIKE